MKKTVILCFLFIYVFPVLGQEGFLFEKNVDKVVIPFKFINNLIFIPIKVNGIELNFLLDSGVQETILFSMEDKKEVSFFNVEKITLRGLGSEESVEGLKSGNNTLEVKGLKYTNHLLYIVLDQSFNLSYHIGIPVNGIIGYNFFKSNLVEINYERKRITVYRDKQKIRKKIENKFQHVPITIERSKPYITGSLVLNAVEIPVKLLIDIGNSDALWLFENKEKNINIPKVKFEDYLGKGFSGDIHGFRAKISSIQINSFKFANPIVAFPDSVSIKSVNRVADRVGSIGGELLKRFNIIFDYPNQTFYLKKSSYYDDPFSYNMSGIELQNDGMQWVQETVNLQTVNLDNTYDGSGNKAQNDFKLKFTLKPIFSIASVRKNSPAEASGLQVGDLIISINKVEAYRYSLQSINDLLKSEEGKWLYFDVERNGKKQKFKFQLKSLL